MEDKNDCDMKKIEISIIIPIYRGQKHIQRLIYMLNEQKNCPYALEVILVNDFPGETLEMPKFEHPVNISVRIIKNDSNMGIHRSRINGLKYAKGDYVIFLDQDDTLLPDYIDKQLEQIEYSDAVICNGLWRNGEKIFSETNPVRDCSYSEYLISGYPLVSLGQLMIKKASVPKEWTENHMISNGWDDHFLWAVMMAHGVKVKANDEVLYIHEEDGNNASFDWKQMYMSGREFERIFLSLNLLDDKQEVKFKKLIEEKCSKYGIYETLSEKMRQISHEKIIGNLKCRKFYQIGIYGLGVYGKKLIETLENSEITVLCGIDRRKDIKNISLPVMGLEDKEVKHILKNADAVVVTAVFDFQGIRERIKSILPDAEVISLLDLMG